jgi:thiol-disulfide isomerase/thioredoxin
MTRIRRSELRLLSILFLLAVTFASNRAAQAQSDPDQPALHPNVYRVGPAPNQGGPSAADGILRQAESAAGAAHKNVLAVFSASWCGPCHMFEAFLHDPQTGPLIDANFVIARFDVGEHPGDPRHADTPGAVALRASLDGPDPGYPFLVILDPAGKTIVNSYRPVKGKAPGADTNIGYPALPVEIDWFMEMLHQSAPSISPKDAATLRRWLQQKATH